MFDWFDTQLSRRKAVSRERQIRLAFPAYEANKRAEHILASLRKFPTDELEQELHKKLVRVREEVRFKYSEPIAILEKEIAQRQGMINDTYAELSIMEHSYKTDLDPLYEALNALGLKLKAANIAKQDAYSRLKCAKARIEGWHAKSKRSPFLFGNGGAALPKHSMFGQSFGDLDSYKSDRSSAADDIKRYTHKIKLLNDHRDEILRKVSLIKESRQRMFDLKCQGRSVSGLQYKLSREKAALCEQSELLSRMRNERAKMLNAERHRTGAVEIEKIILALKLKRDDFIKSFDAPDAAAARYAAHIEDWINAHGS